MRLGCVLLVGMAACAAPPSVRREPPEPPGASAPAAPQASAPATAPPAPAFVPKKVTLEHGAMGTRVTLTTFTTPEHDEAAVKRALATAFGEFSRLEKLMSTWIETSDVSRINAAAGTDAVVVGRDTFVVIEKSLWIAGASQGVFDISFDAMRGLWRFDEGTGEMVIPPKAAIDKARRLIDHRQIETDAGRQTVKLRKKGMRINLGGIAKGYAVDAAAMALEAAGLRAYFVQAGGDLFVRGKKPDGSRFVVGVRDPRGASPQDHFAAIQIEDRAFSTAGDYERAFVKDGRRYHHIIDPRTGYPATASRSVTIWAPTALLADALDDAVFILGPQDGLALVEAIDGAGAVIVDKDNKVWISERLKGLVHVERAPTDGI
jgi:thiamine biosynthesis lipoprotein